MTLYNFYNIINDRHRLGRGWVGQPSQPVRPESAPAQLLIHAPSPRFGGWLVSCCAAWVGLGLALQAALPAAPPAATALFSSATESLPNPRPFPLFPQCLQRLPPPCGARPVTPLRPRIRAGKFLACPFLASPSLAVPPLSLSLASRGPHCSEGRGGDS